MPGITTTITIMARKASPANRVTDVGRFCAIPDRG